MGTVYNTQDECGEVMLNIKASDRCFLPDAGPREDDTGSIILKGLSIEGAVGMYCLWCSSNSNFRTRLGSTWQWLVGMQHWNNNRLLCVRIDC